MKTSAFPQPPGWRHTKWSWLYDADPEQVPFNNLPSEGTPRSYNIVLIVVINQFILYGRLPMTMDAVLATVFHSR